MFTIKADSGRVEELIPTGTHELASGSRCVAAAPDQSGGFGTATIQQSRAFIDFILLDAVLQQTHRCNQRWGGADRECEQVWVEFPSLAPAQTMLLIRQHRIISDYWAQLTISRCSIPMKEISRAHEYQTGGAAFLTACRTGVCSSTQI